MDFSQTPATGLRQQARSVRRMNIIFSSLLLISTLVLAGTTSMGSRLFHQSETKDNTARQQSSPFESMDESQPLPLLVAIGQENEPRVLVKGHSVASGDNPSLSGEASGIKVDDPAQESTDFIKHFAYSVTNEPVRMLTFSWSTTETNNAYFYVVASPDTELFSIEATELFSHSQSIELDDQELGPLTLSIYHQADNGNYELVESTTTS